MSTVNSNHYTVLKQAATVIIRAVLPSGRGLLQRVQALPVRVKEVVTHGVRRGAMAALAAAHLCLQPEVDLRAVEPGFSPEVPGDVDVEELVADFSAAANTIAVVVSVEHVIQDAPHMGNSHVDPPCL
jgi:hypothetical protein